jgi:riboflavin kinase/FMN adenylyltransferase
VSKLGRPVSSSRIRGLIREGRIGLANSLLGRPFTIFGRVVHGDGRGERLGFPTANIHLDEDAIAPFGVYKVEVEIDGNRFKGAMNIGLRPTFKSRSKRPTAEVFIFDFNKRIYGKKIAIRLIELLRLERRFKDSKALVSQIRKDVLRCGFKSDS